MNNKIVIHNSRKCGGVLQCKITLPDKDFILRIEVPEEYDEYLCDDFSDPAVLMCLEYGMAKGWDIVCEQPMSERLYFQMKQYFIPLLADNTRVFNKIELNAETLPTPSYKGEGVGTGLSCGVDSFNTILEFAKHPISTYRLTHLLFLNNGAMGTSDYEKSKDIFKLECEHVSKAASELGLEYIPINTNMVELYSDIWEHLANNNEGPKIASVIYALRKLFSIYYIASSVEIGRFHFSDKDVTFFAPFTFNMLSSDIRFYLGDLDNPKRIDKIKTIEGNPIVQRYLHLNPVKNCGKCPKCIRTLLELEVTGYLDKFNESFDLNDYRQHRIPRIINYFSQTKEYETGYAQEIINANKGKGVIPFYVFPLSKCVKVLRNVKKRWR